MTNRHVSRVVSALLGGIAVTTIAWCWKHRLELFVLPTYWNDAQRMQRDVAALDPTTFTPEHTAAHEAFDRAMCHLLLAQDGDFRWGRKFSLRRVRAAGGARVSLVQYEPRESEDSEMEYWPTLYAFLVIDTWGRLLSRQVFCLPDGHVEDIETMPETTPDGGDLLLVVTCCGLYIMSVDDDGIVPRGACTLDPLHAPTRLSRKPLSVREPGVPTLARAEPTPAAWHRALSAFESGEPDDPSRFVTLLRHEHAELRARAACLLGSLPEHAGAVRKVLSDVEPRVRAAAGVALAALENGAEFVAPLLRDPERLVRILVLTELQRSSVDDVALSAIVQLLREGDMPVRLQFVEPQFLTAEVAAALVSCGERALDELSRAVELEPTTAGRGAREDVTTRISRSRLYGRTESAFEILEQIPTPLLQPHAARLVSLCQRALGMPDLVTVDSLAVVLSRLDDRRANAVVVGCLNPVEEVRPADFYWRNRCAGGLARHDEPALDRVVLREMSTRSTQDAHETELSDTLACILADMLAWRATCDTPEVRALVRQLRSAPPADGFFVDALDGPCACALLDEDDSPDDDLLEFDATDPDRTPTHTDSHLAAAILLNRWQDPGAPQALATLLDNAPALRRSDLWRAFGPERP